MRAISLFLFLLTFFASSAFAQTTTAAYGKWQTYSPDYDLVYPDFKFRFVSKEPGPFYPGSNTRRMGDRYNFKISKGDSKESLGWSLGTGEIGPASFSIGGKEYVLEMMSSYVLDGAFQPNDKVLIWPEAEWQALSDKRMKASNQGSQAK